jgi:hypothetical protein
MLKIQRCVEIMLTDGAKVVSLTRRPPLYSPDTFLFNLEALQESVQCKHGWHRALTLRQECAGAVGATLILVEENSMAVTP